MEKKHCILYRKIILILENRRTLGNMLFIRKRKKSKLILYREKGKKRKNYK